MGFLLTYLLMFTCSFVFQSVYSYKKSAKNPGWFATISMIWLISFWVFDALIIFGVFDWILIHLNHLPWVSLPVQNTGLYWYYNCLLLGLFDLGIPIQGNLGTIFLAICLLTAYMPTYRAGQGWGKAMFGKRPTQKGILPFLLPLKKPKNWREMEQKWNEETTKRAENEEEASKMVDECLELAKKVGMKDKIRGFKR